MRSMLKLFAFVVSFGIAFYFFYINSHQSVTLFLYDGVRTPELPLGLVVVISFLLGMVCGVCLSLLTYVIKKISS